MDAAIAAGSREYVCVAATHTVMAAQEDPELRAAVLGSSLTVPDGQPLVWALRAYGHDLGDRVYGPELMERACARAARTGARIFLYGGRDQQALDDLVRAAARAPPGHRHRRHVQARLPAARARTSSARSRRSSTPRAPDIVWVGLGVPRQEKWMATMRPQLDAPVLVGVGAAFDFLSGTVAQAPAVDAARRPGVALPPHPRAASACGGATPATTRASSVGFAREWWGMRRARATPAGRSLART